MPSPSAFVPRPLVRVLVGLLTGGFFSAPANAIGLGGVSQSPVVGQALRIEIPLILGPGEAVPAADCVRLLPPSEVPDRQFFPRGARAVIDGKGVPRVRIVSAEPVNEPLIEFRLAVGCDSSFARDYLVLAEAPTPVSLTPPPARSATAPKPAEAHAPGPALPPPAAQGPVGAKPAAPLGSPPTATALPVASGAQQTLTLTRDSNLNALARQRYPENQATRDEYRRLMARANPELFAGAGKLGSVPLPAGTVLLIPADLPPPETDAQSARAAPSASATMGAVPPTPASPKGQIETVNSAQKTKPNDRLVIGGETAAAAKPLSPREVANSIERMERLMDDQGRREVEIIDNLHTLNAAFIEVKNYVQALEARAKEAEATQRALQNRLEQREPPPSLGVMELLALILAAGTAGAGLIVLNHRLQMRRLAAPANTGGIVSAAPSAAPPMPPNVPTAAPVAKPIAMPASVAMASAFADLPALDEDTASATPVSAPAQVPATPAPPAPAETQAQAPLLPPVIEFTPAPGAASPAPSFALPDSASAPVEVASAPPFAAPPELPPVPPPASTALPMLPDSPDTPAPMIEFSLELEPDPKPPMLVPVQSVFPPSLDATESAANGQTAVELAEIMSSMGLGKEAARTLVEHILANPKADLAPWLKALDIYRRTGQRDEFEWLASTLRQHLNVQANEWEADEGSEGRSLLEFRHIVKRLTATWPGSECADYLATLLTDNREGVRLGFPQSVAEEILLLQGILREAHGDGA